MRIVDSSRRYFTTLNTDLLLRLVKAAIRRHVCRRIVCKAYIGVFSAAVKADYVSLTGLRKIYITSIEDDYCAALLPLYRIHVYSARAANSEKKFPANLI